MSGSLYKQIQGKAGPRQVKNPTLGLAHNLGGAPGGGSYYFSFDRRSMTTGRPIGNMSAIWGNRGSGSFLWNRHSSRNRQPGSSLGRWVAPLVS
jgi:hypothetical protein